MCGSSRLEPPTHRFGEAAIFRYRDNFEITCQLQIMASM